MDKDPLKERIILKIIVVGSGSIIPTKKRFSSSILLETENRKLLLDVGPGTLEKLGKSGVDVNEVERVLITHFHIDHVGDLPAMIKLRAYSRSGLKSKKLKKLHIYGPKGLVEFLDDLIYRNRFLSYLRVLGCTRYLVIHEVGEGLVEDSKNLRIYSIPVEHFEGVAYRVEADNISLVYSGDTIPDERMIEFAQGVDVLIHECSFPHDLLLGKHTSDKQLAEIARRVKPRILVAVHLYPLMEEREKELKKMLEEAVSGRVIVAEDMEVIEV